ncbi:MAG: Smr/MutS family protein [Flavobacteriaceae bacterium]|nr:Smr/MutS family protein [Flavobacteriaceae bacterium]
MSFEKGNRVVVLDDAVKGKVIKVTSSHMVQVETSEGFVMEFLPQELVKIGEEQSEIAKTVIISQHLSNKTDTVKKRKGIKIKRSKGEIPPMEVDLHLDKLTKSTRGMDNYDKLSLQVDTAKYKLEFAIKNRIPRVVFIHGVGEGVLKEELRYLFNRYDVKVSEASYQKYGMGATEVYILQANN